MNIYAFADEASPEIPAQIEAMKRNGLSGLEIRNVDGENVSVITLEKAKEVRKRLDGAGLVTWSVGSPIGKFRLGAGNDFEAEKDKLKHTLEIAEVLGAKNLRMFSFWTPKGEDPTLYRNEVMDKLGAFTEIAAGAPVLLCHENEKAIYGDTAVRCREILDTFPSIQGVFDPANFVQCHEDTLKAWALLKDRIKYMHIKDALSDGTVVPPGEGEGNVEEIVRAYAIEGGRNFTVEPHLYSFKALKTLEEKGRESIVGAKHTFGNADAAFDTAVSSFRAILGRI